MYAVKLCEQAWNEQRIVSNIHRVDSCLRHYHVTLTHQSIGPNKFMKCWQKPQFMFEIIDYNNSEVFILLQVISRRYAKCTEIIGKCVIVHTLLLKKTQHKLMGQVLTLNDQWSVISDYILQNFAKIQSRIRILIDCSFRPRHARQTNKQTRRNLIIMVAVIRVIILDIPGVFSCKLGFSCSGQRMRCLTTPVIAAQTILTSDVREID